jgi:protease-4|tara:strand:- start:7877 stop:9751 length:1875 start_codon:yes stop_codon:yes gene_type:complete
MEAIFTLSGRSKVNFLGFFKRICKTLIIGIQVLASLLIVFISIFILIVSLENGNQPLPEKAALKISPVGSLVEQKTFVSPLKKFMEKSGVETETLLSELITAIDYASSDKRITNLVLDLDYFSGGGISKLEELGQALTRFKSSGKPITAIGDSYNQEQYFLASFADEIHLNPMGSVLIEGYSRHTSYFKDALDQLKVNVNVFRVGAYKDAIEPFTRNNMSDESREHTSIWVNELWRAYTKRVEKSRGLPENFLSDYSNNLGKKLLKHKGNAAELAINARLVDKISNRKDSINHLISLSGMDDDGGYQHIDSSSYMTHIKQKKQLSKVRNNIDHVALITASGPIELGDQPNGKIGSESISQLIKQAREDDSIKAVVIRINSPGGGAFASEVIRQDIIALKEHGKPVIVSMGAVAASGGFWIAMGATEIWSTPTTITGSIGVFGVVPTFEETLQNVGIRSDGVDTTTLSNIYQISRPMSDHAKQVVQSGVDYTYSKFLSIVAKARNTSVERVGLVAQGRVWTGEKALELGLIDKLGGLNEAISAAANIAELDNYELLELTRPLSIQEKILNQIGNTRIKYLGEPHPALTFVPEFLVKIKSLYTKFSFLEAMNDPRNIYLSCFECVE